MKRGLVWPAHFELLPMRSAALDGWRSRRRGTQACFSTFSTAGHSDWHRRAIEGGHIARVICDRPLVPGVEERALGPRAETFSLATWTCVPTTWQFQFCASVGNGIAVDERCRV